MALLCEEEARVDGTQVDSSSREIVNAKSDFPSVRKRQGERWRPREKPLGTWLDQIARVEAADVAALRGWARVLNLRREKGEAGK